MTGIRLGVTLPQFTGHRDEVLEGARRAEAAGLDSVWLFDHLWPLPPQRKEGGAPVGASAQSGKDGGRTKEVPILEAWTTLAYLAAATRHITIGTLVTRSSLRHPAVLAKMAATAGVVAPGRIIVGIGSGDLKSRAENEAYGLPYWSGPARRRQLISTIETLRDLFDAATTSSEAATRDDGFVRIEELWPSPRAPEAPRLWVGGNSDWVAEFAGRAADGWNAWGITAGAFAESAVRATAGAAGRPIELSWGGGVVLGSTEADALRRLGSRDPSGLVVGTPEVVAGSLRALAVAGASHLIASLPSPVDPDCIELLATEVKPLLGSPGG